MLIHLCIFFVPLQISAKGELNNKIKECLNNPKNEKTVNEILLKMGRVLQKKRALQNEAPVAIFEDRIWVGNYSFANNRQFLEAKNIKRVVSCLDLSLSVYLPNIHYEKFDLKDGQDERFEETVLKFIDYVQTHNEKIFVHCFSGRSRSVALIIGFIMHKQRRTYDEAHEQVKLIYPIAAPNSYFQQALRKMEEKLKEKPISEMLIST